MICSGKSATPTKKSNKKLKYSDLSCFVCYETYTLTDDFIPYSLPCGHTICSHCIKNLNQCPLCQMKFSKNDAKKNYALKESIQQQQQLQQQLQQQQQQLQQLQQALQRLTPQCCLYSGTHPFFIALFNSPISVAQYILASCPDINMKDESGNTPLHIAASLGFRV